MNEEAAETAEEATDLIGWILNHRKVRSVFNETQAEISVPPGKVLAFLVANLTRWTTHFIAFDRLQDLKDPLRCAVISRRADIISGQVGAEKNRHKKQKLGDDATAHCEVIDDGGFWRCLKTVVDDLHQEKAFEPRIFEVTPECPRASWACQVCQVCQSC